MGKYRREVRQKKKTRYDRHNNVAVELVRYLRRNNSLYVKARAEFGDMSV